MRLFDRLAAWLRLRRKPGAESPLFRAAPDTRPPERPGAPLPPLRPRAAPAAGPPVVAPPVIAGPRISVVIATAGGVSLGATLDALHAQTLPAFEIIVVRHPCLNGAPERLRDHPEVRVLGCADPGVAAARNLGVEHAGGEIVAFLGEGAVPGATWLQTLAAPYADPAIAGAGGPMTGDGAGTAESALPVCGRDGRAGAGAAPSGTYLAPGADPFLCLPAGNMSLRRSALIELGGFDEALTTCLDNAEICRAAVDAGLGLAFLPDAAVAAPLRAEALLDDLLAEGTPELARKVHDLAVFALRAGGGGPSAEQALARIHGAAADARNEAMQLIWQGRLRPDDLNRVLQQIDEAVARGLSAGSQTRSPRAFSPAAAIPSEAGAGEA